MKYNPLYGVKNDVNIITATFHFQLIHKWLCSIYSKTPLFRSSLNSNSRFIRIYCPFLNGLKQLNLIRNPLNSNLLNWSPGIRIKGVLLYLLTCFTNVCLNDSYCNVIYDCMSQNWYLIDNSFWIELFVLFLLTINRVLNQIMEGFYVTRAH